MHDIDDPVSIGKTGVEVEEVGTSVIVMEPPGTGEEVNKDPLDTAELEEDDPDKLDSVCEDSDVGVDCEEMDPEET
jgi:hypothetical protein